MSFGDNDSAQIKMYLVRPSASVAMCQSLIDFPEWLLFLNTRRRVYMSVEFRDQLLSVQEYKTAKNTNDDILSIHLKGKSIRKEF